MSDLFVLLFLISVILFVLGLVNPKWTPQFTKEPKTRKRSAIIYGVAIIIFFTLIGATSTSTKNSVTKSNSVPTVSPVQEIKKPPTPTVSNVIGLNISRDTVMNRLQNADPTINFQPSTPVNGIERYMAEKGQNGIELYGKADNLVEVASSAILGNSTIDVSGNTIALIYILGVAKAVDVNSLDWITSTIKEIGTAWSSGQNSVKKSTVINGKKFDISATKSDVFNSVSISIYSSQLNKPPTEQVTPAPTSKATTVITADHVLTTSGSSSYHAPATDISGYPGLTKVLIKASVITDVNGMTFTNNENEKWDACIDTINPDSGASNWYEYDFGNMAPGQSSTIQWSQLTKADNTVFMPNAVARGSSIIELSCELGAKTMGFARFQY